MFQVSGFKSYKLSTLHGSADRESEANKELSTSLNFLLSTSLNSKLSTFNSQSYLQSVGIVFFYYEVVDDELLPLLCVLSHVVFQQFVHGVFFS